MEAKGANPFLFAEDDSSFPANNSNPFLMSEDDYNDTTTNDNPFLNSQTAAYMSSNSTNPFAFDPMEFDPPEAEPAVDLRSDLEMYQSKNTIPDFLENTALPPANPPQKPTGLDLKHTHTVAEHINVDVQSTGPARPPPPPRPPPSKETQDLLMSVMGAMDATSSHLLDKIPPTRTPSPVSMRDLHSPSPTPEPVGDLLDVSDHQKQHDIQKPEQTDLLSLNDDNINICDINQNPPMLINQTLPLQPTVNNQSLPQPLMHHHHQSPPEPTIIQSPPLNKHNSSPPQPLLNRTPPQPPPPRPTPPAARPPRPLPPQKPPPPEFTPPKPPDHKNQEEKQEEEEELNMFGEEEVPQKTVASTADIMNLYSAPQFTKPQPKQPDLLFDSVEVEMKAAVVESPIVQDSFVSPEPSDLQMDTSDSQSKGSVSSVTFNPFAGNEEGGVSSPKPALSENNVFGPQKHPEEEFGITQPIVPTDIFGTTTQPPQDIFGSNQAPPCVFPTNQEANPDIVGRNEDGFGTKPLPDIFGFEPKKSGDDFDAFAMKFESAAKDENKNGGAFTTAFATETTCWGNDGGGFLDSSSGFENDEPFDSFLSMQEPPSVPQSTPNKLSKAPSQDSDEDKDFSVFIRPKANVTFADEAMPVIAPPPAAPAQNAFTDTSPRFNPFDHQQINAAVCQEDMALPLAGEILPRSDSQETPPTPLFDDDVSQPLEPFPRVEFNEEGWELQLRQPNKKKITGQRFWKKIFVRIVNQSDCVLLQLFNQKGDRDPFQELPLQPCYSVSDIGAQQYDNFGKIFTLKLQYIFYKERPGVRPGQVKKAERITNKLSQFASYAIQGDYQGVKEFGSDLKKLGLPVEHAPQVSQLMKLGSLNYEDLKQFSVSIEESLFKLQAHRDRALHYKMEEVQITTVDELYVEQDAEGHIERQIARVRLLFLGFLTGMPDIELGINDMRRQGKEVVGRHDIIPVVTEEWIRLENVEFHSCIQQDEYQNSHIIKFKPPDACYIELLRFRVRPPKNRELPLQLKTVFNVTGNKVVIKADVLVPGFASRKLGQVPCEDVMIKIPIPECWIYLFRVEKHFRYGSVKSTHRRTGKVKGLERILGTMETLQESLIEVTSGQAKYEHQHRAIVWRCPRLPKEGQGAYTTHNLVSRLALTSYDQVPDQLAEYCYVEFTMPATQVSHTTVRSVSLQNSDSDDPPEKYVRYLARHEYRVGIEHTEGDNVAAYSAVTYTKPAAVAPIPEQPQTIVENESSDDSD